MLYENGGNHITRNGANTKQEYYCSQNADCCYNAEEFMFNSHYPIAQSGINLYCQILSPSYRLLLDKQ